MHCCCSMRRGEINAWRGGSVSFSEAPYLLTSIEYTLSLPSSSLVPTFQSAFQVPLPPISSNVGVIWISTFDPLSLSLNLSLGFLTHIYDFEYYLRLIISQPNFSPKLRIHMSSFVPHGHSGNSCLSYFLSLLFYNSGFPT